MILAMFARLPSSSLSVMSVCPTLTSTFLLAQSLDRRLAKQWAAVRTCRVEMRAPPQKFSGVARWV